MASTGLSIVGISTQSSVPVTKILILEDSALGPYLLSDPHMTLCYTIASASDGQSVAEYHRYKDTGVLNILSKNIGSDSVCSHAILDKVVPVGASVSFLVLTSMHITTMRHVLCANKLRILYTSESSYRFCNQALEKLETGNIVTDFSAYVMCYAEARNIDAILISSLKSSIMDFEAFKDMEEAWDLIRAFTGLTFATTFPDEKYFASLRRTNTFLLSTEILYT
jgi:hypothetical protein